MEDPTVQLPANFNADVSLSEFVAIEIVQGKVSS
jgi:hypothetical protein